MVAGFLYSLQKGGANQFAPVNHAAAILNLDVEPFRRIGFIGLALDEFGVLTA
jgi:hypothetical protein